MKKYYYLSTIIAGFVLLSTSCSKEYGYNFENGYSSGIYEDTVKLTIDTNRFKIDYTKYAEASLFPGLVGEKEPRLTTIRSLSIWILYMCLVVICEFQ